MSSSRSIMEILSGLSNSPNYCQQIQLKTKMNYFQQFKCEYEPLSNPTQILPPSVWFAIDEVSCLASIANDVGKSRISREGMLSTNQKGNLLNKVNYQQYEEDIGTIQQTQQSFCVSFAVIKDTSEDYLKHISSEMRSCLMHKLNLIDRDHLKLGIKEKIPRYIYSKFRVFLIFDTKTQPDRVVSIQNCFYPNIRFIIERIKKRENIKFAKNQVLENIQSGQCINDFGFLSLDAKSRLLMIKKEDPQLYKQNLIGVWVISSYPLKRTRKQFGKQDAIWAALLDYYTNSEIQSKLSIISKNRGFMAYFSIKQTKIGSPQFYLFEPSPKTQPKWTLVTKPQFIIDWKKPYEIKIDFVNNTIMEEKEYSQFSDQTNNLEQISKYRDENINRENIIRTGNNKNYQIIANQSGVSGESNKSKNMNKNKQQDDEKIKTIKQLRSQLQKYKLRCMELEAVNKILMQQKMMSNNHIMYGQYMTNQQPLLYPYGQIQNYAPFPLSYSQVSQGYQQQIPIPPQNQVLINPHDQYKQQAINSPIGDPTSHTSLNTRTSNQSNTPKSANHKLNQPNNNSHNQKQNKSIFVFPDVKQQAMTFGTDKIGVDSFYNQQKQKLSFKKSSSYGNQQKINAHQQFKNADVQEESFPEEEKVRQIHIKKDLRNISFQDSFAQYHSDGQDQGPKFKFSQYEASRKVKNNKEINDQDVLFTKSPEFKRVQSLNNQMSKAQMRKQVKQLNIETNIVEKSMQLKSIQKLKLSQNKQIGVKEQNQVKSKAGNLIQEAKFKEYESKYSRLLKPQSDESENEKQVAINKKEKQQGRKQLIKKNHNSDDSQDSDEDAKFKQHRLMYLKR